MGIVARISERAIGFGGVVLLYYTNTKMMASCHAYCCYVVFGESAINLKSYSQNPCPSMLKAS